MILISSIHNLPLPLFPPSLPPPPPPPPAPDPLPSSPLFRLRHFLSLDALPTPLYPPPVPNLELHSAAASGNVGLVHYALTHGQPVNSVLHGVLPLHAACSGGSLSVVRMLIERGADVDAPRLPRRYSDGKKGTAPSVGTAGSTPLHFAAANGHAPIVQMLLACGADPHKPDKNGHTPEDLARLNHHDDVVRVLHVYQHLKHQDAMQEAEALAQTQSQMEAQEGEGLEVQSDRADMGSPGGSVVGLPDDLPGAGEGSSAAQGTGSAHGTPTASRKGKERAFSLSSNKSEGAIKVKKSLESLLRRSGTRLSLGSTHSTEERAQPQQHTLRAPPPPRLSLPAQGEATSTGELASPFEIDTPLSPSPQKGEHGQLFPGKAGDEVDSSGGGSAPLSTRAASPNSLHRVLSGQSAHSNPSSIILSSPPPSSHPPSLAPTSAPPTPHSPAPSTASSTGLGPPPARSHLASTSSRRPSLPSIFEKAVHPGMAFRAAIRHHHDKDGHQQHGAESPRSASSGGSFFRGRKGSDDGSLGGKKSKHSAGGHGHSHGHGFKSLFRRGHSPPSRSPSPPKKNEAGKAGKVIAADELDESIERLKRASLDLERGDGRASGRESEVGGSVAGGQLGEAISLNEDDEGEYSVGRVPASAPVTKTKFYPDELDIRTPGLSTSSSTSALGAPPRLPPRRDSSSSITTSSTTALAPAPGAPTSPRPFNRPRTGSEVIAPSPLAMEWAESDSDSAPAPVQGIRRVRTEIIRQPSGQGHAYSPTSPSSLGAAGGGGSGASSPGPGSPGKPRALTMPSVKPGAMGVGLGWQEDTDLRKVAAEGSIRRENERIKQECSKADEEVRESAEEAEGVEQADGAEQADQEGGYEYDWEGEGEGEGEEYYDALQLSPVDDNGDHGPPQVIDVDVADEESEHTPTESTDRVDSRGSWVASTTTSRAGSSTGTRNGRIRGGSIGSITSLTESRISSPPPSTFRMSAITDDGDKRGKVTRSDPHPYHPHGNSHGHHGRPRGNTVSSTASSGGGSGGLHSTLQLGSTPPTSLTPPSALSPSLGGTSSSAPVSASGSASGAGFPPVPEHEVVSHPPTRRRLTSRTISSHAEAQEAVKQSESEILQLAQLPPSLDSSRSLAAQLAAYGESHAIEQEFAEMERREKEGRGRGEGVDRESVKGSEGGESYYTAAESRWSAGSGSVSGSGSKVSERRGSSGRMPPPLTPLIPVVAPRSTNPKLNSIYDKRAAAYRDRMAALTSASPLPLASSSKSIHSSHGGNVSPWIRQRQRASSAHEMWLDVGPKSRARSASGNLPTGVEYAYTPSSGAHRDRHGASRSGVGTPNYLSGSASASGSGSGGGSQEPDRDSRYDDPYGGYDDGEVEEEDSRYPHISGPMPVGSHVLPGQRSRKGSNASMGANPLAHGASHRAHKYSLPPSTYSSRYGLSPPHSAPLGNPNRLSTASSSSAGGVGSAGFAPSPYASIFSHRYSGHPLNDDESDDEEQENGRYTLIENDWRGGHVVDPAELRGGGEKKKWGPLRKLGRK
ncbi:hypothetical protein IAT38_005147 [Cryptococcus sp. DSM 104549]